MFSLTVAASFEFIKLAKATLLFALLVSLDLGAFESFPNLN